MYNCIPIDLLKFCSHNWYGIDLVACNKLQISILHLSWYYRMMVHTSKKTGAYNSKGLDLAYLAHVQGRPTIFSMGREEGF